MHQQHDDEEPVQPHDERGEKDVLNVLRVSVLVDIVFSFLCGFQGRHVQTKLRPVNGSRTIIPLDASRVLMCFNEREWSVWDMKTDARFWIFRDQTVRLGIKAASPAPNFAVFAILNDTNLQVWDLDKDQLVVSVPHVSRYVTCMITATTADPKGAPVITILWGDSVGCVHSMSWPQCVYALVGQVHFGQQVQSLAALEKENIFVSVCDGGNLAVWTFQPFGIVRKIPYYNQYHPKIVKVISLKTQFLFATLLQNSVLKLWCAQRGACFYTVNLATSVAAALPNDFLIVATPSGDVCLLDMQSKRITTLDNQHKSTVRSIAVLENNTVVTSSDENPLCFWK